MTRTSRGFLCCCALLITACGVGDTQIDPGDSEPRDLPRRSPELAPTKAASAASAAGRSRAARRSRTAAARPASTASRAARVLGQGLAGIATGDTDPAPVPAAAPPPIALGVPANPYAFYGSISECAAVHRDRCTSCLASASCTPIANGDGNVECARLAANDGEGYMLFCINLAISIDAVASCAARRVPSCPRDVHASNSLDTLGANIQFRDDGVCAVQLDSCLADLYGAAGSPDPTRPSRDPTAGCGESCDDSTSCELELEDDGCESSDGSCDDSGDSSGCDDSGGDAGGDCGGDGEDACGSSDSSSCDSSDCGGGGDSDCGGGGGGGGGDCDGGGGGGDCSGGGGGGDCSGGGGGDCGGGGGGDCNVGAKRGRAGAGWPIAVAWALLPLPFATIVRRRADRRRARAEHAAREAGAEPVADQISDQISDQVSDQEVAP